MRAKLSEEQFINWWLEKYHNTNLAQILRENPEWKKNPHDHTREFYNTYRVTQAQHDEWYEWAIGLVMKTYRFGKKTARRQFALPYLNVAPSVHQKTEE